MNVLGNKFHEFIEQTVKILLYILRVFNSSGTELLLLQYSWLDKIKFVPR